MVQRIIFKSFYNLNLNMSKKIFINNLNTFVSEQLMAELRNDGLDEEGNPNPDANLMFGTFIDKDSSEKPDGIKKMLKVSINNAQLLTDVIF